MIRNKARDRLVSRTLRKRGWSVLRIWEHELAHSNETRLLRRIQLALRKGVNEMVIFSAGTGPSAP